MKVMGVSHSDAFEREQSDEETTYSTLTEPMHSATLYIEDSLVSFVWQFQRYDLLFGVLCRFFLP